MCLRKVNRAAFLASIAFVHASDHQGAGVRVFLLDFIWMFCFELLVWEGGEADLMAEWMASRRS